MNNSTYDTMNISTSDGETFYCHLKDTNLTRVLKIVVFFIFSGFCIVNNSLIIVLAAKYTVKKNLHHLIINMAMSDILVVLSMLGIKAPSMFNNNAWGYVMIVGGEVTCKLLIFLSAASIVSSLFTLLIISIKRFTAIALQKSRPYTLRKRATELMCSWLASFALASTKIPSSSIYKVYSEKWKCTDKELNLGFSILFYAGIVVALCTIIILSIVTLRRLSIQQTIQNSLPDIQRQARAKRMANALKMVLSSLLLYLSCYLPFASWQAFESFSENISNMKSRFCQVKYVFEVLEVLLPLVNSCFSPVIYLIFLSDFREAAKRLVCTSVHPLDMRTTASQQERPQDLQHGETAVSQQELPQDVEHGETVTPRPGIALRKIMDNKLKTTMSRVVCQ